LIKQPLAKHDAEAAKIDPQAMSPEVVRFFKMKDGSVVTGRLVESGRA